MIDFLALLFFIVCLSGGLLTWCLLAFAFYIYRQAKKEGA